MRHQSQKGFWSIFVGIQQHQKGYLIYVPSTQEIISLYEFLFDGGKSNAFAYTSRPYSEAIEMRTAVSYILYAGYSHEQTGGIITFSQVEQGGILKNEPNFEEDKSIPDSIDELFAYDNYDDESISTNNIDDIRDGSYVHTKNNARDARFKISDLIRQFQNECKVE